MFSDRDSNRKSIETQAIGNIKRDESTPDKNSKSKQTKSTRKRKRRHSSSEEEDFDTSIDAKLRQSALRNNLTPQNVKNILQKVVRNDHVLAIVKLKEEELERREQTHQDSRLTIDTSAENSKIMDADEMDDTENAVPKLTRAKAKALNKFPLPVAPIKHSEPDSEVVALIREELHSDDDDEEYQPGEDDIESDDDINTTTSDIDSQPATPSSQADPSEESSRTMYTTDGLFKIPRARTDSTASQSEQEYIIAQQTRSKISLAETPIEAIESTFKAPDAPLDMYQMEPDVDPHWIQFLNNFAMPLTSEMEKDEDADPDYCPVIVDSHPDDREEFQHVNVSKKEVNDLLNELYSFIDVNLLDLHDDTLTLDTNPQKQATVQTEDLNQSLITPVKQIEEPLTTPDTNKNQIQPQVSVASPTPSNSNISYFVPTAISTPAKPNLNNNTISPADQTQSNSFDSFNSTLLSTNESTTQYSYQYPMNTYSLGSLEGKSPVFMPFMSFTTNSSAPPNNAPLPYSSILITMPNESIITSTMPSTVISSSSIQSNDNNSQLMHLNQQINAGPMPKKPGHRAKRSRFKNAAYRELENLDPNTIQPQYFHSTDKRGFTLEQRQILECQLRMHVQFATQSYIQTYGHPELYSEAYKVKRFLIELADIVDKGHAKPIYNLKPALELATNWETELSLNTKENTELVNYLKGEMNKLRKNMSYAMQFHDRILKVICESKVFMYPDLLPPVPFRFTTSKPSEYFPAEDFLLALLLEHFFNELRHKMVSYKYAKPREVTLTSVCQHISAHLGYIRHSKSIYDYVRLRRNHALINPIKFYFQHKQAPPVRHRYEIFDPNAVIEPAKQPVTVLPAQWAQYVQKLIGLNHDAVLNRINTISSVNILRTNNISDIRTACKQQKPENVVTTKYDVPVQKYQEHIDPYDSNSLIKVKILYEHSESKDRISSYKTEFNTPNSCASEYDINENSTLNGGLTKGQTLLTSYFQPIQRKSNKSVDEHLEITLQPDESSNLVISDNDKTDREWLLSCRRRIRRKYSRLSAAKYLVRMRFIKFLVHLVCKARKQFAVKWHRFQNKNVLFVYQCLITYHRFTSAFIKGNKLRKSTKMTTESISINRRVQKLLNDNASARDVNEENAPSTHTHNDAGAKRLAKNQRSSDNSRLLLLTENAQESSEKDQLFAQRFLERVEETFINENKHNKLIEFLGILRNFSENQHHQTGADLYLILEKFFMPDYPDFADFFLHFLTPNDAVAINKSMDYFFKMNLFKFLNKLNIYYQKQPAQVRKVLACLKELSEESDVPIDRIRSRILPLLKGNQPLIDWFWQCIGPDKCESSKEEYETLVLRKGTELFDDDQFEYIPQSEILPDPSENPCHIRYMNGRIFYGNRFPLPTKLSFGAVPYASVTSDTANDDRQLLMGSGDKTFSYRCVHNIKEFADNKMRDRHHSEYEHVGNCATTEEIDNNSDDEQQCVAPLDKVDDKHLIYEEIEHMSSANTPATDEHILCDNTLLRAHSIRLNPALHTSLVHSNVELLNKLKPPDQLLTDANKELRLSPKKQATSQKTSQGRKINSPNAKKLSTPGCKSPNNKKTTSPLSSITPENMDGGYHSQAAQESNAVQTAKKLKRILETNEPTPSSSQSNEVDDISKRLNVISNTKTKSQKSHMLSKPIKKQKRAHDFHDSDDEEEMAEENGKKQEARTQNESNNRKEHQQKDNPQPEIQWTREEDRLLLEQIKAGFDSNNESITEFAHQFPSKTQDNIRDRIDFLIDFLTKLRNKK